MPLISSRLYKKLFAISTLSMAMLSLTACQNLTNTLNQPAHKTLTQESPMTTIDHKSPFDFDTTVNNVKTVIDDSPAQLFATIEHSKGANKVGMELNPTTLFIFGNPKVGTPALQDNQKLGIEFPIKLLVWQDDTGQVYVSEQNLDKLATDYQINPENIQPLKKALNHIISTALQSKNE